jgi:hypothetical protein
MNFYMKRASPTSTSFVQHDRVLSLVKENERLALMCHERSEIISHDTVPREPILVVEKLLDVLGHVRQLPIAHLLDRQLRRLARVRPHVLRVRAVLVHVRNHLRPVPRRERAPRTHRLMGVCSELCAVVRSCSNVNDLAG